MENEPIFPFEMELEILKYVEPNSTIIISYVCKRWRDSLSNKYESKILDSFKSYPRKYALDVHSIQNDSYMFNRYCDINDINTILKNIKINDICSKKCLNRLVHKILYSEVVVEIEKIPELIEQYLKANINNPVYLEILLSFQ